MGCREQFDISSFTADVRDQSSSYLLQGMALTAALAFNSAVGATISHYYPYDKETLGAKWLYAVVIVIILILAVYIIGKQASPPGSLVVLQRPAPPAPEKAVPAVVFPDLR